MQLKTQLYIDGKWVDGSGTVPVYDPSDESVIAEIATAGDKECEAAIDAAHRAFPEWAKTAPRFRAEILRKAFELMIAESDHLAKIISMENGKVFSASIEVPPKSNLRGFCASIMYQYESQSICT